MQKLIWGNKTHAVPIDIPSKIQQQITAAYMKIHKILELKVSKTLYDSLEVDFIFFRDNRIFVPFDWGYQR